VVIMTDADVDGSHIRTLLLTFFYRKMRPLIEAGYVYIANPPLFKVTRRKNVRYIDNEEQLDKYLIDLGCENVNVSDASGNQLDPLEIKNLVTLFTGFIHASENLRRVGVEPEEYFRYIIEHGVCPVAQLDVRSEAGEFRRLFCASAEELERTLAELRCELHLASEAGADPEAQFASNARVEVTEILEAPELTSLLEQAAARGFGAVDIHRGERVLFTVGDEEGGQTSVKSLSELFDLVRKQGQSGIAINRYKGLGEMNPIQLWETTMDPANRKMIKVSVADAVQAERMFTLLMGDLVEPRREYIEKYAAGVTNLDI